jgi:uncharacterized protein (DUF1697 family)
MTDSEQTSTTGVTGAPGAGTTSYVALLRGINVGGHRKVPMAELRTVLAGLGHGSVRTYLQSGNAVFTAPSAAPQEHARRLREALAAHVGFSVDTLVLSAAQLRATAGRCPFPAERLDPAKLAVAFLDRPPAGHPAAVADPADWAPDELRLGEREMFAYFPDGMGRSKLGERLSAPWPGAVVTVRNWRSVVKLLELSAETGGEAV